MDELLSNSHGYVLENGKDTVERTRTAIGRTIETTHHGKPTSKWNTEKDVSSEESSQKTWKSTRE